MLTSEWFSLSEKEYRPIEQLQRSWNSECCRHFVVQGVEHQWLSDVPYWLVFEGLARKAGMVGKCAIKVSRAGTLEVSDRFLRHCLQNREAEADGSSLGEGLEDLLLEIPE